LSVQAARLLPDEQLLLLPHIALRVVTHKQASPLPPPAEPARLTAAVKAAMQCVRWLTAGQVNNPLAVVDV